MSDEAMSTGNDVSMFSDDALEAKVIGGTDAETPTEPVEDTTPAVEAPAEPDAPAEEEPPADEDEQPKTEAEIQDELDESERKQYENLKNLYGRQTNELGEMRAAIRAMQEAQAAQQQAQPQEAAYDPEFVGQLYTLALGDESRAGDPELAFEYAVQTGDVGVIEDLIDTVAEYGETAADALKLQRKYDALIRESERQSDPHAEYVQSLQKQAAYDQGTSRFREDLKSSAVPLEAVEAEMAQILDTDVHIQALIDQNTSEGVYEGLTRAHAMAVRMALPRLMAAQTEVKSATEAAKIAASVETGRANAPRPTSEVSEEDEIANGIFSANNRVFGSLSFDG